MERAARFPKDYDVVQWADGLWVSKFPDPDDERSTVHKDPPDGWAYIREQLRLEAPACRAKGAPAGAPQLDLF